MVRSALGEMFWSAKNLSRRRRKTLGKDDAAVVSPAACRGAASDVETSDGTRSYPSVSRLITDSVSDATSASTIIVSRTGNLAGGTGSQYGFPERQRIGLPAAGSVKSWPKADSSAKNYGQSRRFG